MWIIVYGNVLEGLDFVGPFVTMEDAENCVGNSKGDWNLIELKEPEDDTKGCVHKLLCRCGYVLDDALDFVRGDRILPCEEDWNLPKDLIETARLCREAV